MLKRGEKYVKFQKFSFKKTSPSPSLSFSIYFPPYYLSPYKRMDGIMVSCGGGIDSSKVKGTVMATMVRMGQQK